MVFGALHHTITHFFLDFLLAADQTYELVFFYFDPDLFR